MKKSTLIIWVGLLSITLVCAQGVKRHVHSIDHDQHSHHSHHALQQQHHHPNSVALPQATVEHTHISIAHLSTDISHSDHHDSVIIESDACPDCLLSKLSSKIPFMALLAALYMWVLFGLASQPAINRPNDILRDTWRRFRLPLLRAPPA